MDRPMWFGYIERMGNKEIVVVEGYRGGVDHKKLGNEVMQGDL